jgi:signal peptidase II
LAETEPPAKVRTAKVRTAKVSAVKVSVRALIVLAVVALAVYGFDQFSKYLIVTNMTEGEQVSVLGQVLQFYFVKNSGAAFSIASGSTWVFSIAASAVTVFIIVFARKIRSIGWAILFGMLLGGTAGNLTDRLFREPGFGVGHVVDFIKVYGFPAIFNIADSFIVASMGLFIILTIRGVNLDGRRAARVVATAEVDDSSERHEPASDERAGGKSSGDKLADDDRPGTE